MTAYTGFCKGVHVLVLGNDPHEMQEEQYDVFAVPMDIDRELLATIDESPHDMLSVTRYDWRFSASGRMLVEASYRWYAPDDSTGNCGAWEVTAANARRFQADDEDVQWSAMRDIRVCVS